MFAAVALALFTLLPAALAQITVATPPSVVVCEPAALSWTGGTGPYYVSIIPGGNPGATALENFPTQSGNSFVWNVNIAAGTSITIQVRDSIGNVQYSSPITIQSGPDSSCVGQSASISGATSAAGTTAAGTSAGAATTSASSVSASSAAGNTMTSMTSSASSASTASHSSSSSVAGASSPSKAATSPSSSPSSAASASFQVGALSVAGLAGLVGALLF